MLCVIVFLSSCYIYKLYDRFKDIEVFGFYWDIVFVVDILVFDIVNFGNLFWREVFIDF